MRKTFVGLPRWARYAIVLAVVVDVYVAVATALFPAHDVLGGLLGGPLGILGFHAWRNRDFDRLSKADRLRVVTAERSGVLTGDDHLDTIARRQLAQAARGYRSDRILEPVLCAAALVCPVVATFRRDNAWWLLLLLPMLPVLRPGSRSPDPRAALAALEATRASGTEGAPSRAPKT